MRTLGELDLLETTSHYVHTEKGEKSNVMRVLIDVSVRFQRTLSYYKHERGVELLKMSA